MRNLQENNPKDRSYEFTMVVEKPKRSAAGLYARPEKMLDLFALVLFILKV